MKPVPEHLGGHKGQQHYDEGALKHLKRQYSLESMIDIGCGIGGMVRMAARKGLRTLGVDGDWTVEERWRRIVEQSSDRASFLLHDFTAGPLVTDVAYGLVWCVEFLEHIEAQYLPNVFETFRQCPVVFCTHALPGHSKGYHHVNEQDEQYWIDRFEAEGFKHDEIQTANVRGESTMPSKCTHRTGKVFLRCE